MTGVHSLDLMSATLLLLVIMDPLGNIPVFFPCLERVELTVADSS